jgi:hypothetical protein
VPLDRVEERRVLVTVGASTEADDGEREVLGREPEAAGVEDGIDRSE